MSLPFPFLPARSYRAVPLLCKEGRGEVEAFLPAPSNGAIPRRLRAWLRPSPETLVGGEDCLSEASSAAQTFRDRGKGTRRAAPGRQWFWVLLPKQKDLGARRKNPLSSRGAETPQNPPPFLSSLYVFSNLLTIPAPPFPSFVRRGEGR